jgi:hypothetical protein
LGIPSRRPPAVPLIAIDGCPFLPAAQEFSFLVASRSLILNKNMD